MIHLHCGLHKTGTTSFQYSCIQNRHLLHIIGLDYPEDHILTIGSASHLALARDFKNSLFLIDKVNSHSECELLLSCEELINTFDNFSDNEILFFFNGLSKRYNGLNLIITIRDEKELALSLLKQHVEGSFFSGIDSFLFNYKNKIERLFRLSVGFNVNIINMDDCPPDISLATYYLKSICGRVAYLPHLQTNVTKSRKIIYYFLHSFRKFYSELKNVDIYCSSTSDEISRLYDSISIDEDYNIYLENLFNDFIQLKVNNFFKNDKLLQIDKLD